MHENHTWGHIFGTVLYKTTRPLQNTWGKLTNSILAKLTERKKNIQELKLVSCHKTYVVLDMKI